MRLKTYTLTFLLVPLALFGCMLALNIALDPDEILRKGDGAAFFDVGKKQYSNAGIIKHYPMRNLALGGSMMSNVIASEAAEVLNWPDTTTLIVNGADTATLAATARLALRHHKIDNMLISLAPERMAEIDAGRLGKRGSQKNFMYLYDGNDWNDAMVFLQTSEHFIKTTKRAKHAMRKLREKFPTLSNEEFLAVAKDGSTHYMSRYADFNRPLLISSIGAAQGAPVALTDTHKQNLSENLQDHLLPLVAENPQTKFVFVVEPTTFLRKTNSRALFSYGLREAAYALLAYPNVEIHAFANDAFNADLRLFRDLDHPHIEISRFMLHSIAKGNHRLTRDNLDAYLAAFGKALDAYTVDPLWQAEPHDPLKRRYPTRGYLSYSDAARLVWGDQYSDALYNAVPRARALNEATYVEGDMTTNPPLNANRARLQAAGADKGETSAAEAAE